MIEVVIEEAKRRLKEDPFDAGHDYEHHLAVVTNCINICINENLTSIDQDALLVAAWWHDYKRNQEEENDRILTETIQNSELTQKFINKVLSIKNSHSFGNDQENLEQKVLFDADKLEYASVARIARVSAAVKSGDMPIEVQKKYASTFKDRIGKVLKQLHFESSKKEMVKRIEEVRDYVQNDPLWAGIVDGL